MDDEALRSEFAALLAPVRQIPVPDSLGLRRRVRRRRAGQSTATALACACVAATAGLLFGPPAARTTPPGTDRGGCASSDLVVRWLPPAQVSGAWVEAPPQTYLLSFRNAGASACSLSGWPRFVIAGSSQPRPVSVSYETHFGEWVGIFRRRVVEPTRIVLEPGATAVSVVTVVPGYPALMGCITRAWLVKPPTPGEHAVRTRGDLPELCVGASITASPLYPPSVPITENYP